MRIDLIGPALRCPCWKRYLIAVAIFAVALGARLVIFPADAGLPYLSFHPAVVAAALLCGFGPAMVVIGLSVAAGLHAFTPPYWAIPASSAEWSAAALFSLSALAVVLMLGRFGPRASSREQASGADDAEAGRAGDHDQVTLADVVPALLWASDQDKQLSWLNQQWFDLTRHRAEVHLGSAWTASVHPDDVEQFVAQYHACFDRREPFKLKGRLRSADGTYRWFNVLGVPRYDPGGVFRGYVGACTDITVRKQAEDAVREQELRLNLFIDGVPVGIAMFDRELRFVATSRRFLEDHRVEQADVTGLGVYEVFPDAPRRWRENFRRGLGGETIRREEDAFVHADGQVTWRRWEIRPWRTAAGEVGGVILFSEDISARKRAEDELRVAKGEAERANNTKSRFLASASHDLRQPLVALSLYAGALETTLAPPYVDTLANMRGCIDYLGAMLSDLLELSKLEGGGVTPRIGDFEVDSVLAGIVLSNAPEAEHKGLALRCHRGAVKGRSDPVLFQRIVGNLVSNAIRYTREGGVLVGCRRRHGKTWVEVWDTGIGIPVDKTAEIFEEFAQLGNAERNPSCGSGLGLAIVAKSAKLLGLEVRVRSRPGKGSMFAVEIPPGHSIATDPVCPVHLQRSLRIAVVEDNADVCAALDAYLAELGHTVVAAASRRELLTLLDRAAPDIVIADYGLEGGETGLEVIAALRARFGAQLPALILTGNTAPELVLRAAEQGVILQYKPMDVETLRAIIARLGTGAPCAGERCEHHVGEQCAAPAPACRSS